MFRFWFEYFLILADIRQGEWWRCEDFFNLYSFVVHISLSFDLAFSVIRLFLGKPISYLAPKNVEEHLHVPLINILWGIPQYEIEFITRPQINAINIFYQRNLNQKIMRNWSGRRMFGFSGENPAPEQINRMNNKIRATASINLWPCFCPD